MTDIRAFIAIDLSDEARAVLADVVKMLTARTPRGVKWVGPDRMHLTLRFLGATPTEQLQALRHTLDDVARQQRPFTLSLDALGCFPNERKPRIIWIGLRDGLRPLQTLREGLDESLQPLGWTADDRPFHPHLTLGRVKDHRARVDLPWGQGVAPAEIPVSEIVLYESQLRPDGPRYIVRHTSPFG